MDQRKKIVREAYDAIAEPWGRARRKAGTGARERMWLERFYTTLPIDSTVLDLGCGSGAPILTEVLRLGHRAVGVDFSSRQLHEARSRCPTASFLQADITELEFKSASFGGVIAYDSLWHLPRNEHGHMFHRIRSWMIDRGALLLTLAAAWHEEDLTTDLMGAPVFYSARPAEASLGMLAAAGFAVLGHHLEPISEARAADGHLVVLAEAA